MQKIENYYLQDNSKLMPEADEPLYFTIEEKSNSIQLTEKGIDTITSAGEDSKFFIIPDIGIEINAIENSNKSLEDITKSKEQLGYSPKVSLREGLAETVSWYKVFFELGKPIQSGGFKPPENLSYNQKQFNNDTEAFI